jgi:hypothetical protein
MIDSCPAEATFHACQNYTYGPSEDASNVVGEDGVFLGVEVVPERRKEPTGRGGWLTGVLGAPSMFPWFANSPDVHTPDHRFGLLTSIEAFVQRAETSSQRTIASSS